MLDTPQITQTTARLTAVIRLTIPRAEIRTVMGPGIGELMSVIAAQGIAAAGPWYTHHLRMDPNIFDFEIGVPVAAPVVATGRVRPGEQSAAKVARTIYHGPYEGLGAAWGEFGAWIKANGHTPAPDLWECYLAGPETNPDPATFRTELNRPLVG
jgi:effector-binding domain-containing protein